MIIKLSNLLAREDNHFKTIVLKERALLRTKESRSLSKSEDGKRFCHLYFKDKTCKKFIDPELKFEQKGKNILFSFYPSKITCRIDESNNIMRIEIVEPDRKDIRYGLGIFILGKTGLNLYDAVRLLDHNSTVVDRVCANYYDGDPNFIKHSHNVYAIACRREYLETLYNILNRFVDIDVNDLPILYKNIKGTEFLKVKNLFKPVLISNGENEDEEIYGISYNNTYGMKTLKEIDKCPCFKDILLHLNKKSKIITKKTKNNKFKIHFIKNSGVYKVSDENEVKHIVFENRNYEHENSYEHEIGLAVIEVKSGVFMKSSKELLSATKLAFIGLHNYFGFFYRDSKEGKRMEKTIYMCYYVKRVYIDFLYDILNSIVDTNRRYL